MTLEDWDRVIATDVWSVVVGTHFAYQVMLDQEGGQIVNVRPWQGCYPGA